MISNRLRMRSPYLRSRNATGMSATAMKPSSELPHPRPSARYIGRPARGRTAPAMDRMTVLVASAEAA